MRALLSTIGSRGDVQPVVALAARLRDLGHDVRVCVPPDFQPWIEGLGIPVTPIGPELRAATAAMRAQQAPPTIEQRRQMIEGTVATQFDTIAVAARGCDVIVGATALQAAAPSVAEMMGIPYVFAAYCPIVLPSPHHTPPHPETWNEMWGPPINARRAAAGLTPVTDVRTHIFTNRPWLAADATLGPWPDTADDTVFQTGAWILPDARPLPADVERFLDAGEPPVYFGFGSMRAPEASGDVMIQAARAVGRRAIVSRGWSELLDARNDADCLAIGEANVLALFTRVAAVVHHGGAGTTTAAALAGKPQVAAPQGYDQHYWARRVAELGVGVAHESGPLTAELLTSALEQALRPGVAERARAVAPAVRTDGTDVAAERLRQISGRR